MDTILEYKLRKEFDDLAPYLKNDDTDRHILVSWKNKIMDMKNQLSEEFLREFSSFLDPYELYAPSTINKDFVRELKDMTFYFLMECFMYHKVNEEFIKEFARPSTQLERLPLVSDYMLNDIEQSFWRQIARNQEMSEELIKRNWEKVDWEELQYNFAYMTHNSNVLEGGDNWTNNFSKFKIMLREME